MEFILNHNFVQQPKKADLLACELRFKETKTKYKYTLQKTKGETINIDQYPSFVECIGSLKLILKTSPFDTALVISIVDGSKGDVTIYDNDGLTVIGSYKNGVLFN